MRLVIETGGVRHHSLGHTVDRVRHVEPARFEILENIVDLMEEIQ